MRRPAPMSWMLTIVLIVLTIPVLMAAQVPTNGRSTPASSGYVSSTART